MVINSEDLSWENFNYEEIINAHNLDNSLILKGILGGIKDIIGVYLPNGSIIFYNKAGYEFYNTTQKEIAGKKCFDMLGRTCRCEYCTTEMAIRYKKLVRIEKFFPELDLYMECTCNPIVNNCGEVVLVIEQLRDITEKKKLELVLKASEEGYRNIVEL